MRVLLDYRSALRNPSGVGEYTRQLSAALAADAGAAPGEGVLELTLFSSSWKDRLLLPHALRGLPVVDRRVPVSVLNFAWHRLGWPAAETLAGRAFDVVHSFHPLLMPARRAAQVVTVYDLDFLTHPERTSAEVRRDYQALVPAHARRADHVIVISQFTAGEVESRLGVPVDRLSICRPGAPDWPARSVQPADGYLLFLGTLEPRKNLGTLLDAYEALLADGLRGLPHVVVAGRATADAAPWLERIGRPPLAGRVRYIGYVDPPARQSLYAGARLLVLPSFEEGFGMTALEAMATGVPVVAACRGAIPEVVGEAGLLVEPDAASLAGAIRRIVADDSLAAACAARGVTRARQFRWADAARAARQAYGRAIRQRRRTD